MPEELKTTPLTDWHRDDGAKMVPFAGFSMPVNYGGTDSDMFAEAKATHEQAVLTDPSHMGEFTLHGDPAKVQEFLRYALANDAALIKSPGISQPTLIANTVGGAIDDALLFRLPEPGLHDADYMLVVNAANREADFAHLKPIAEEFGVELRDDTFKLGLIALQGPKALDILTRSVLNTSELPPYLRNHNAYVNIEGTRLLASITGYTGQNGAELFVPWENTEEVWEHLLQKGNNLGLRPAGLGARDISRTWAALNLHGHELGAYPKGFEPGDGSTEIPIQASRYGRLYTTFSDGRDFIGRAVMEKQREEITKVLKAQGLPDLPLEDRLVPYFIWPMQVQVPEGEDPRKYIPRTGNHIYSGETDIGAVTSGALITVPVFDGNTITSTPTGEESMIPMGLALVRSDIYPGEFGVKAEIPRGKRPPISLHVVKANMEDAGQYKRPVIYPQQQKEETEVSLTPRERFEILVKGANDNHHWRRKQTINLIPSEMPTSSAVDWATRLDPAGRYTENLILAALGQDALPTPFYQGTGFSLDVETAVQQALARFIGSSNVEARFVSATQANEGAYTAILDYINYSTGKSPRKFKAAMVNDLITGGGHLSHQYLGALHGMVDTFSGTNKPRIFNFPLHEDEPWRIDVDKAVALALEHDVELVVFGRSLFLVPEPIKEFLEKYRSAQSSDVYALADYAHPFGIIHQLQDPLAEGANLLTFSTHKTYPGPQKGGIAHNYSDDSPLARLGQLVSTKAFPGKTSNSHPGDTLGLLVAHLEMEEFGRQYAPQVIANARALAADLAEDGFPVQGPPDRYTDTHQVYIEFDNSGEGLAFAQQLEENNIIVNAQAGLRGPFLTAAGIRLGVQEMTRRGMKEHEMGEIANYIRDVRKGVNGVQDEVTRFVGQFPDQIWAYTKQDVQRILGQ